MLQYHINCIIFFVTSFAFLVFAERHPIFIFHFNIAQRQETGEELIYCFQFYHHVKQQPKFANMTSLASSWILLLLILLVSSFISIATANGNEIYENRGIKSVNGGDDKSKDKGIQDIKRM